MRSSSTSRQVKVFAAGSRKVLKCTTRQQAELMEQLGAWEPLFNSTTGDLLGYQIVSIELRRVDLDVRSMPTQAAISAAEMQIVAGEGCRSWRISSTYGLNEQHRLERLAAGRLAEDRAERVVAKFRVYPHVGSAKGDILRVWPK